MRSTSIFFGSNYCRTVLALREIESTLARKELSFHDSVNALPPPLHRIVSMTLLDVGVSSLVEPSFDTSYRTTKTRISCEGPRIVEETTYFVVLHSSELPMKASFHRYLTCQPLPDQRVLLLDHSHFVVTVRLPLVVISSISMIGYIPSPIAFCFLTLRYFQK